MKNIKDGVLYFDGCSAVELAKEYGTPLYVMSETDIVSRMDELKECFIDKYPNTRIAYASKAFCTTAMYKICKREGISIDVVSGGEIHVAEKVEYPPELIEFNGNNKLPVEIEQAIDYGVGRFIVDSLQEVELIESICSKKNKSANVLFRITPGIAADTHDYIVTGKKDSKFGIPLDDNIIYPQIEKAIKSEHINFLGLHVHLGSQLFDNGVYLQALDVIFNCVDQIKERFGVDVEELNMGGGFGVTYTNEERKPYSYFLDPMMSRIDEYFEEKNLTRPSIVIEPGRSIVAEAGITLYTVGSVKDIPDVRKYVSIDGGMGDNIRPSLYQAEYKGVVANKMDEESDDVVTICGKNCESGDILIRDCKIPSSTEAGDLIAIYSTGAYGYSMASNYNNNPIPAMILVKDGKHGLIVKRQTYDDIIRNNVLVEWL